MGKHGFRLLGAFGLSLTLALASGWSAVADDPGLPGDDGTQGVDRFAQIDPSLFQSASFVPTTLSDQPISVILELTGAPVAVQDAEAQKHGQQLTADDKRAIRQRIEASQNQLHDGLAAARAQVVGQMQDAYNGIQVVVPQSSLSSLATLPGVTAIHAVQTYELDNTNGVPYVGAPQAWENFAATGAGVKVGIIDTGIDYTHADFGGPGTVVAWKAAFKTSTAPPDPSLVGPKAPKVKGGHDFVGDAYDPRNPATSLPMPDDNPLDCNGHGTHTAGSLAGFGVLSDGSTFAGAYNASTIKSNSWNVGPGVAPQADLYVYRVFGCNGPSNVVALAINRAVADGVNVISMSLGSDLGGTTDPTSVAAQNAFNDSISVVASAGNAGQNAYLVGSPSTANGVLAVAAVDGSSPSLPGASLSLTTAAGAAAGPVLAVNANGAVLPKISLPVKVLRNPDGSVSLGCNKAEYAGTAGMVVVTMRGVCARVARAVFGDEAGAAAVVMINSSSAFPPFEGPIRSNPDTGEQHSVTIPFLGVRNVKSDVNALLSADGGAVLLADSAVANTSYQTAASFSSGGPRSPDSAPKPDVIAPGVSVGSAAMGTGNQRSVMSGTSMACPMAAGVAALVKQAHPGWTGAQIKAAIMNTAGAGASLIKGYNSRVGGAGVVRAQNAVNSTVLATTADALDSIAFGYVPGSGDYAAHKTLTLTNYGTTTAAYNLTAPLNSVVSVAPASVTIAPGATADVQVSLVMSAAAFASLPSDDTFTVGPGGVVNVRGVIIAAPAAGDALDHQVLRVPFMLVPRGLSNVAAAAPGDFKTAPGQSPTTPGHMITATLPLSNTGIHSGAADLFTWGISEPMDNGLPNDVRAVGLQVVTPTATNGIHSGDRALVFVINTWGQAATQSVNQFEIAIDTNGDGVADFFVVGADIGRALAGASDGRFGSFTINAHTLKIVDARFADAPMNGSIVELPTLASDLGLTEKANGVGPVKKQGITYQVTTFSLKPGGMPDVTGEASINPFSPSISSSDSALLPPGATSSFTLLVDTDAQKAQPALGWLVVSVDNANGAAQAGEVRAPN